MTDRCVEVVLVVTSDGQYHPRICIDPPHPSGTGHRLRFHGTVVPWTHGLTRVHLDRRTTTKPQ